MNILFLVLGTKEQVKIYNAGVHFFSTKTDSIRWVCLLQNAVKLMQKDQQKCKIILIFLHFEVADILNSPFTSYSLPTVLI